VGFIEHLHSNSLHWSTSGQRLIVSPLALYSIYGFNQKSLQKIFIFFSDGPVAAARLPL
jgi:hypothetical protein